jgi:hypothetical protein
MFTSNFNSSNSLVEGIYLILLAAMALVAALSVLFTLGSIACAALDCSIKIKQPANLRTKSSRNAVTLNAVR